MIIEDKILEFDDAWLVPFNTQTYLNGGMPPTGLIPGAAIVPKDRMIPAHYAPTAYGAGEYLEKIREGQMAWPKART